MKKILRKIRNNAGETITETLVALLIAAFAMVMLAGAVSAASGIIKKSSDKMNLYYDENAKLVEMSSASDDKIKVKDSTGTVFSQEVDVKYYKDNVLNIVSFKKATSD